MNTTTITCTHCNKPIKLSDAISHQIDDEMKKAKDEQMATLRKEFDDTSKEDIKQAVDSALKKAERDFDKQLEKKLQEADDVKHSIDLKIEQLESSLKKGKKNEKELRDEITSLYDQVSDANKAREDAERVARKKLLDREKEIQKEASEKAADDYNTKIREQEETINKLREQLTTAKQVAEQGSQQLQGEILELDVEKILRDNFPWDTIDEVKKGERGSDIRQTVNVHSHQDCGLILWETKNAKTFKKDWVEKLKDELAREKAQAGVIVFNSPNSDSEDFKQMDDNIWLVKPRHVPMLATLLREALIKVFIANRNAAGKDVKVEMIYNYLTGGEFNNRIRYIMDTYDEMTEELRKEKKQAQKRWAAQEKIIEKAINSLYGMSGDLQGIAGQEIIALPVLDDDGE